MPRPDIVRRVRNAATVLGIDRLLRRRPRELSGGQRQRVAMGRAIVREPLVFLFDEPLSNLDAMLRVQMRLEIKKLQAELGTTSIYVTHDQVEAMTMADRLVELNRGRAEQIGTPLELYDRPATLFVAKFIGSPSMNLLKGFLNGDGFRVHLSDKITIKHNNEPFRGLENKHIILGVRPEHVAIDGSGESLGPFRVQVVEELGAETILHGQLEDIEGSLTVRVHDTRGIRKGQVLSASVLPSQTHIFNPSDEKRLG
jgi:sn-glycerol 3-phosphate transport system ATP-binding protein